MLVLLSQELWGDTETPSNPDLRPSNALGRPGDVCEEYLDIHCVSPGFIPASCCIICRTEVDLLDLLGYFLQDSVKPPNVRLSLPVLRALGVIGRV